jgi:hypothetical protein
MNMEKLMAEINSEARVTRVIVAPNPEWCERALGGHWVDVTATSAGIGWEYYFGVVRPPQPYPSWLWENGAWVPPKPKPTTEGTHLWDEKNQVWFTAGGWS